MVKGNLNEKFREQVMLWYKGYVVLRFCRQKTSKQKNMPRIFSKSTRKYR